MRWNTKLTTVEVRWIKQAYRKMVNNNPHNSFGTIRMTQKINEGRAKAGLEPICSQTVWRALKKIELGSPIIPIDGMAKVKVICPKCGHIWYK